MRWRDLLDPVAWLDSIFSDIVLTGAAVAAWAFVRGRWPRWYELLALAAAAYCAGTLAFALLRARGRGRRRFH